MTQGSAQPAEPATPWIRNPDLVVWLERVIAEKRAEGKTIGEVAGDGAISTSQLKRWRGIGGPQSIPEPESLLEFCAGNALDPDEPFRILGWTSPAARLPRAHVREVLAEVLDDPKLSDEDVEDVIALLKTLAAQRRTREGRDTDI